MRVSKYVYAGTIGNGRRSGTREHGGRISVHRSPSIVLRLPFADREETLAVRGRRIAERNHERFTIHVGCASLGAQPTDSQEAGDLFLTDIGRDAGNRLITETAFDHP
jgi:hypothetical protein